MTRWLTLPSFFLVASCSASTVGPPSHPVSVVRDPATSEGDIAHASFSKAIFHRGILWMRAGQRLVALDVARGTITYPLPGERVIDLHRTLDDRLWILSATDDLHVWERDGNGFRPLLQSELPSSPPIALTDDRERPVVLAEDAILTEGADHGLRSVALSKHIEPGLVKQLSFAVTGDGSAYAGTNSGEFGGSLYRIGLGSGDVDLIRRVDGKAICAGPLNPKCDPVTGIVADPDDPKCVLVGVGLAHFMVSGRLLRVCDGNVSVVPMAEVAPDRDTRTNHRLANLFGGAHETMAPTPCPGDPGDDSPPEPPSGNDGQLMAICDIDPAACQSSHEPDREPGAGIFGLSRTRHGVFAVTSDAILYLQSARIRRMPLPILEKAGGVRFGWTPGALTVATTVNGAASVSGATPLVAAISLGEPDEAGDLAYAPALKRLASGVLEESCWFAVSRTNAAKSEPERAICFEKNHVAFIDGAGANTVAARWSVVSGSTWRVALESDPADEVLVTLGVSRAYVTPRGVAIELRRATGSELVTLVSQAAKASKERDRARPCPGATVNDGLEGTVETDQRGEPSNAPARPSQADITGALGLVLPSARRCVGKADAVSSAAIVFRTEGTVDSVRVSGAASGKPAASCIEKALRAARVHPFAGPSPVTVTVTIRPH